jgi:ATP-dependent helicase IRC3
MIKLRPYQEECIKKSLEALQKLKRVAVSLPVGSGKTFIFSNLIQQIPAPNHIATKTLVLAHRQELLFQAYKTLNRNFPSLKLGLAIGRKIPDSDTDVIIGSSCTLGRLNSKTLQMLNPLFFKAIVIDEAHHASAITYKRILEYMGAMNQDTHIKLWGCSATLRRHDGIALFPTFV